MKKLLLLIVFIIIIILGAATWYLRGINQKNSDRADQLSFNVTAGQSSEEISQNLKAAGLIKSTFLFDLYAWRSGLDSRLLVGEYKIPKNISIRELAGLLSRGSEKTEKKITIIEGWNLKDIASYLAEQKISTAQAFLDAASRKQDWWDEYEILKLKPRELDLEGYVFPDTYLIYGDAGAEGAIRRMLETMQAKLTPELLSDIKKTGLSVHQILTLASIIEKEVIGADDRKVVAGIFYNRLEIGMALQADSTVNYVTGKSAAQSTLDDIAIDNPYNTYKYPGLPPGPIASPALTAIEAAVYPAQTPYFYFLTTPEGEVIYSRTHDEHVAAKHKYLR